MEKDGKYKILVMVIIILGIVILGLGTYVVYDVFLSEDDTKIMDKETNESAGISEDEVLKILEENRSVYYLNRQEDSILDMDILFNKYNYEMLEDVVLSLFNYDEPQEYITEEEILKAAKKTYGYDMQFNFVDLSENEDSVAFEWDKEEKRYNVIDPSMYGHGMRFLVVGRKVTDIKRIDNNTWDIKTRQLWSNEMSEGDATERFYFSYGEALEDKKPTYTMDFTEAFLNTFDDNFDKAFASIEKKKNGGYYTYRLVKDNDNYKITQYVINN